MATTYEQVLGEAMAAATLEVAVLRFDGARFRVRLGDPIVGSQCEQDVDLAVAIAFTSLPSACTTDQLDDTVCYAKLLEEAQVCTRRSYALLEALGQDLFSVFRAAIASDARLWLRVTHVNPRLDVRSSGVSFALGDWMPGATTSTGASE